MLEDFLSGKLVGQLVWITDYRLNKEFHKKPIRNIKPTLVLVRHNSETNKTIHYSNYHFVKLKANGEPSKTVISCYDNTGYRAYTGEPVKIFKTEQEAIDSYNQDVDRNNLLLEEERVRLNQQIDSLIKSHIE